jgi:hypothetical protein
VVVTLVQNEHQKLQDQHNAALTLGAVNAVIKAAIAAARKTKGSITSKGKWNPEKQARFVTYARLNIRDPNMSPFWGQLVAAASDDKERAVQALLNGSVTYNSTATDANGSYSFPDVEPGDCIVVETTMTGYTDTSD